MNTPGSRRSHYNNKMNSKREKRRASQPIVTFYPYNSEESLPRSDESAASDLSDNSSINSQMNAIYAKNMDPRLPPELQRRRHTTLPEHITAYMIEAPVVNNEVHYRTIGNQACAELLQEMTFVSDYDVDKPDKSFKCGRWHYAFEEKGVTVMMKKSLQKDLHCVLGIGVIEEPLEYVWEIIKNPSSRFHYDRTLKRLKVIDYYDEQTKVIQYAFEKTDCFIKQEREILAAQTCRKYNNGYITAGKSVEHCQCPPPTSIPRVKTHGSGFYLEPLYRNGKQVTKVTYLLQLELPGLPTSLVNYIIKRQPLAIAYLREKATSSE